MHRGGPKNLERYYLHIYLHIFMKLFIFLWNMSCNASITIHYITAHIIFAWQYYIVHPEIFQRGVAKRQKGRR